MAQRLRCAPEWEITMSVTWVLVCNGNRARVLCGLDGASASAPLEIICRAPARHLRAALSELDAPAPECTPPRLEPETDLDPIRKDMHEFARETLEMLARRFVAGDFSRLIVLATPKMLRVLRREMPAALDGAAISARSSNLICAPEHDLRRAVIRMLQREGLTPS
ncbi:Protein required for attachment to host cells [Roseivivax marinus]|nr:host attachment protein [Roseivivax marinus]SEL70322.1 Protein required for attachment to host cells [Roseivivax marinus]